MKPPELEAFFMLESDSPLLLCDLLCDLSDTSVIFLYRKDRKSGRKESMVSFPPTRLPGNQNSM